MNVVTKAINIKLKAISDSSSNPNESHW